MCKSEWVTVREDFDTVPRKLKMTSRDNRVNKSDYAELNLRILQVLGAWNPYDEGIPFWLYRLYMIIVFTFILILYTFLEIIDAIHIKDDLELFTENLCVTLSHLAGISKIIHLSMKKSKIRKILDILERKLRLEDKGAMGSVQEKIIKKATLHGQIVTKTFGALLCCLLFAGMAYPIWDQSYKEQKLPWRCYIPMNTNNSITYWTSYIFIGVSMMWQSWIITSHDTLFVVLMIHVIAQITILKIRMETVCNNYSFVNGQEKFVDEIVNQDVCSYETLSRYTIVSSKLRENNEWITNLKSCIECHHEIIRLVSELQSMFCNVILLQFATSLVTISMFGFQVIVYADSDKCLPKAGYLCCILIELLLYCWYGNEIIVQSESLGNSAYGCSWYQGDLEFCKMLKIFMARTQKPLVVMAGNSFDLSLDTFAKILSSSYSYMAVLNQINE